MLCGYLIYFLGYYGILKFKFLNWILTSQVVNYSKGRLYEGMQKYVMNYIKYHIHNGKWALILTAYDFS